MWFLISKSYEHGSSFPREARSLGIAIPTGQPRPANENHTSKLHFLHGAVSRRDRRDDSAGFNQEAAHIVFGMPGVIRAAWLYNVPLSSRPESRRCIFVGMEWRDLAS